MSGSWLTNTVSEPERKHIACERSVLKLNHFWSVSPLQLGLLFMPLAPACLSAVWPALVWNDWFLSISVTLLWLAPIYFLVSALIVAARNDGREMQLRLWPVAVYLLVSCGCVFYFFLLPIPMFGWDALDQWGRQAANFIEAVGGGGAYTFEYIHPEVGYFVSIFESRASAELGLDVRGASLASAYYTVLASGTRLCMVRFNLAPIVALCVTCAVWSASGIVNSIVLFGYVDFWLTYCIFLFFYFAHFTDRCVPSVCLFGMLFAILLPSTLKDSGFLISIAGFASFLAVYAMRPIQMKWAFPAIACALAMLLPVLILLDAVIDLRELGLPFRVDFERGLINVGSRGEVIAWSGAGEVMSSLTHAFFVKQTYSVSFIAGIFAFLWALLFGRRDGFSEILVIFFILLSIYFMMPLFSSSYFLSHSLPDNDTALSRFSIYYMPVIYFLLVQFLAETTSLGENNTVAGNVVE